ncbi:MAG: VOC family protein [Alphaproteobacteria bacterium]|nr:VOC family protein [Alphaproteobacteria bacterium]
MTPEIFIDHVALTVRDLPGMSTFYEMALGLRLMGKDGAVRQLGTGDQVLVELRADPAAAVRDPRQAGLFHMALLLPSRGDLGRWLRHSASLGLRLAGASDHGVSEALYLGDPEGNGIEIYCDRPANQWVRQGDRIEMITAPLDLDDLARAGEGPWQGAPAETIMGHVHLQVGELAASDAFMSGQLGLTRTFDGPGGAWYGWNGYHHHLAGNIWNSRNAGPRDPRMAGLAEVVLRGTGGAGKVLTDPWGTRFRLS